MNVSKHDKAKEIIRDDYRKLPQSTKQQKQYFQSAKQRAKRAERRRVRRIFAMLEEQQPELKDISIFGYGVCKRVDLAPLQMEC